MNSVSPGTNRSSFTATDIVADIWNGLDLPKNALKSLNLSGNGLGFPSSFKIGPLAQGTIALSALSAATIHAIRNNCKVPDVTVPLDHACAEFKSERLYILNGCRNENPWGALGGLHETLDGHVRIHDGFAHHLIRSLDLLGLSGSSGTTTIDKISRSDVTEASKKWISVELETKAFRDGTVIAALRSFDQWDALPQAKAMSDFPIRIRQLRQGSVGEKRGLSERTTPGDRRCLQGLRVLELSRVIAAPVAGKTLAAHGADVLWITSQTLPNLPALDCDLARGKRTIQLDLHSADGKKKLLELASSADVFIQGYRPGSISGLGFSPEDLLAINSNIIYANMSAYGPNGPWSGNRGFDSLVQTCSGMNMSEAEHFGDGSPAKPTPCQVLDHGAGYLLATGIIAALHRRETKGGAYVVDVSLAGVMNYLRSLGQYPERSGFECNDLTKNEDVLEFVETRSTGLGELTAVKHSAAMEGMAVGWDIMPKPLGSDRAEWSV